MSANELNLIDNNTPLLIEQIAENGDRFDITGFDTAANPASADKQGFCARFGRLNLIFRSKKPVANEPADGITEDALLAVLAKRIQDRARANHCTVLAESLLHIKLARGLLHQSEMRAENPKV